MTKLITLIVFRAAPLSTRKENERKRKITRSDRTRTSPKVGQLVAQFVY